MSTLILVALSWAAIGAFIGYKFAKVAGTSGNDKPEEKK